MIGIGYGVVGKLGFVSVVAVKLVHKILLVLTAILVGSIIFFYCIGVLTGNNCYAIGNCKACWKPGNETSRYNTLVDILLCACSEAKSKNYGDVEINRKIEELYQRLSNRKAAIQDICTGKAPLVKYK